MCLTIDIGFADAVELAAGDVEVGGYFGLGY